MRATRSSFYSSCFTWAAAWHLLGVASGGACPLRGTTARLRRLQAEARPGPRPAVLRRRSCPSLAPVLARRRSAASSRRRQRRRNAATLPPAAARGSYILWCQVERSDSAPRCQLRYAQFHRGGVGGKQSTNAGRAQPGGTALGCSEPFLLCGTEDAP